MRLLLSVRQLVSMIRVATSPAGRSQVAKKRRRSSSKPKGHVAPWPPVRPALAPQAPALMQIEQGILERFRAQMCQALQDRLDALTAAEEQASKPSCCGKPMSVPRPAQRPVYDLDGFGSDRVPPLSVQDLWA